MIKKLRAKLITKISAFFKREIEIETERERYRNFLINSTMSAPVVILPNAVVSNLSQQPNLITIGKDSVVRGELLIHAHSGKISIGESCYIGDGTRIWSSESVCIGNRVLVSHNVNIHDTDSHSIDANLRSQHFYMIMTNGHPKDDIFDIKASSIEIGDDVWIGFNSTILKGVKIGKGSVVAACSVVTKDVPSNVIVAGNPAKIVKSI